MSWLNSLRDARAARLAVATALDAADRRDLRLAVTLGGPVWETWSAPDGIWRRTLRQMLLRASLAALTDHLDTWRETLAKAERLAGRAQTALNAAQDPTVTDGVIAAIADLGTACASVADERWRHILRQAQADLADRRRFIALLAQGVEATDGMQFRTAVSHYTAATRLFDVPSATAPLAEAIAQLPREAAFEAAMTDAAAAFQAGHFRGARHQLAPLVAGFPRADGIELLQSCQTAAEGISRHVAGLQAENAGAWQKAIDHFQAAAKRLPDPAPSRRRLAVIALRLGEWQRALNGLPDTAEPDVQYWRGLALAGLGRFQDAARTWKALESPGMHEARQTLRALAQFHRHRALVAIQDLAERGALDGAEQACARFVMAFGPDPWVAQTLDSHLRPRRLQRDWQQGDWPAVTAASRAGWEQERTLTALHNLTVACFYGAEQDPGQLPALIDILPTALMNLADHPTLQDIPWQGDQPVDIGELRGLAMHLLEERVLASKEADPAHYQQLQARLARERQAMRLVEVLGTGRIGHPALTLLPGTGPAGSRPSGVDSTWPCSLDERFLASLYSPWGMAVSVGLEGGTWDVPAGGDPAATTPEETFALAFVTLRRALAMFQNGEWDLALQSVHPQMGTIRGVSAWVSALDQACEKRLADLAENQQAAFVRRWHDLLGTPASTQAHITQAVRTVYDRLTAKTLTLPAAKTELEALQRLDRNHPLLKETLTKVTHVVAMDEVFAWARQHGLESAVVRARNNGSSQVRLELAEFCFNLAVEGNDSGRMGGQEIVQLGLWAKSLAPHAPNLRRFYDALGI